MKFCSVACRSSYTSAHPETYPQTRTRRGSGGFRDDLGRYFRSAWEANYARYLEWLKKHGQIRAWWYEPQTFEFSHIKRGSRFYTPDFKVLPLTDEHEWHEIKGYMDERSATKIKRFRRCYPHERLLLIEKPQYNAIAIQMRPLIPAWEGRIRKC